MMRINHCNYTVECDHDLAAELLENENKGLKTNWFNFELGEIYYDNNCNEYHIQEITHNNDRTGYVKLY